uniref:Uncharacterized protein n=1 Tax=uncultured bacterium A1Q1_fos_493 TaxID=1256577 RepID=L7VYD9_9BACT|nr:hypothetical protein [uncultured bacterium A1Q1_fos_493]
MTQPQRKWLPFLDWFGIWPGAAAYEADGRAWVSEAPQGVQLAVQMPVRGEPMLIADRPWESALGYATAFYDEGRYRLWYGAQTSADGYPNGLLCYAESADGFQWEKPAVGQFDWNGSRANNIVFNKSIEGCVFRDPSADAAERYKLIFMEPGADYQGQRIYGAELNRAIKQLQAQGINPADLYGKHLRLVGAVYGAVSPDGLQWCQIEEPLFEKFCDTQNVVYYDTAKGNYVGYWRTGNGNRRAIARSETADFRHWPLPEIVLQPDGQDAPTDDYYTNGYSPYPGNNNFHLMFPSIYRRVRDFCDVQLAVSRNGVNWSWPERRPILAPTGPLDKGGLYPGPGLIPLTDNRWGLLCRYEAVMHNESYYYSPPGERTGSVGWATWPRDRLVALAAPLEGQVTLNKQRCSGEPLLLNYQTEANGWIQVELIEPTLWPPARLAPIPGYAFADCTPLQGDNSASAVHWQGSADLSALRGREICMRIRLCRAKLFALSLEPLADSESVGMYWQIVGPENF